MTTVLMDWPMSPEVLRIKVAMHPYRVSTVQVDDDYLRVVVNDVEYPVSMDRIATYSDRLRQATRVQRARYEVSATGIHWPELDEDPSCRGLIHDAEKAVAAGSNAVRKHCSPEVLVSRDGGLEDKRP